MKPVYCWYVKGWLLKREDGTYLRRQTGEPLVFGTRTAARAHLAPVAPVRPVPNQPPVHRDPICPHCTQAIRNRGGFETHVFWCARRQGVAA